MVDALHGLDLGAAKLHAEWEVTVQTPVGGLDGLLAALGANLPLQQGHYDNCCYVRDGGRQRFRALAGAHAGAEESVQTTAAAEVVFCIERDAALLRRVFEVVFEHHVQEEPTLSVREVWGSRSKYLDDKENPNRYWNRADAAEIHGVAGG